MRKRMRGVLFDQAKVRQYAHVKGITTPAQFEIAYMRYFSIPDGQNIGAPNKAWNGITLDKSFAKNIAELLGLKDLTPLLEKQSLSPWISLIDNEKHHADVMTFQWGSETDNKLINMEDFQKESVEDLDEISIKQNWCLRLKGESEDQFFVVLQSQEQRFQVAPLDVETFVSIMPKMTKMLRYPSEKNFTFTKSDGLGWRRCTVIRAKTIPIQEKSFKTGFTLLPQELDEFALRLTQNGDKYIAVDFYEFMLVK